MIPIMVDEELPITEEVVMPRRINGPSFQEQQDDIDSELNKFDNGKEEEVGCGLRHKIHDDDQTKTVMDSLVVGFVQLNEGLSQSQGPSDKGSRRLRVSKRPKLLTNEGRIKPTGRKVYVLSKRSHRELDSEDGSKVGSKKSRNAYFLDLSVEVGSQPRQSQ